MSCPTFDQLRRHLREHPHHYHIVHFDGHGSYRGDVAADGYRLQLTSSQGQLIFEGPDGKPDPKTADDLATLLREFRIPAVVLNACQSAMVDHNARDAFASVATAMLKAGVRSVVAMAYSLYVSGAQRFLPAFYQRLFETGHVGEAVRAGRREMFSNKGRVCARGNYDLDDWMVPVLYEQDQLDFSFASQALAPSREETQQRLDEGFRDEENPYVFVGRDGPLLKMERAMRRNPAGILIDGLGGIGKTTFALGFGQ